MAATGAGGRGAAPAPANGTECEDGPELAAQLLELEGRLRQRRNAAAQALSLEPHTIFDNAMVGKIARAMPTSREELLQLEGISHKKAEQFASLVKDVVGTFLLEQPQLAQRKQRMQQQAQAQAQVQQQLAPRAHATARPPKPPHPHKPDRPPADAAAEAFEVFKHPRACPAGKPHRTAQPARRAPGGAGGKPSGAAQGAQPTTQHVQSLGPHAPQANGGKRARDEGPPNASCPGLPVCKVANDGTASRFFIPNG